MKSIAAILTGLIVLSLPLSTLAQGDAPEDSLKERTRDALADLEQLMQPLHRIEKERAAVAKGIQKAEDELTEDNGGIFSRWMARRNLRNQRQKYHQLSQQMRETVMGLRGRGQEVFAELAAIDDILLQRIREVEQDIETQGPKQNLLAKLEKRRSERDVFHRGVEEEMGPLAPMLDVAGRRFGKQGQGGGRGWGRLWGERHEPRRFGPPPEQGPPGPPPHGRPQPPPEPYADLLEEIERLRDEVRILREKVERLEAERE